jgi:Cu-Zn family superoxide dismutase
MWTKWSFLILLVCHSMALACPCTEQTSAKICACTELSSLTIFIHEVLPQEKNSVGRKLGTIQFEDTKKGLKITPNLQSLAPGVKGFHIHQHPSCNAKLNAEKKWEAAGAAGAHFDPQNAAQHLGPNKAGHLGDLPVLKVNPSGIANHAVIAPRVKLKDILGHSIIIHQNGDNYSDMPQKLGGGGPRIACGVLVSQK